MTIVYCGELYTGGSCRMRLEALRRCGHTVVGIDQTPPAGLMRILAGAGRRFSWTIDACGVNRRLLEAVERCGPSLVWIDRGLTISPATLMRIRRSESRPRLVHYGAGDVTARDNQSRQYLAGIPIYDLHVTTKTFTADELCGMGAVRAVAVHGAFCPCAHKPVAVHPNERTSLGGPVGFIGSFEQERAESLYFLAEHGISVRIWGRGWKHWSKGRRHARLQVENRELWADSFARAICSFEINLAFVPKVPLDHQTTRWVEITACRAFLMAERTPEHQAQFREGAEAEFFGSRTELLEKCRYYLAHPAERDAVAAAARDRCLRSDYSYDRQVQTVIEEIARACRAQQCAVDTYRANTTGMRSAK
jgi:hypothetical protein